MYLGREVGEIGKGLAPFYVCKNLLSSRPLPPLHPANLAKDYPGALDWEGPRLSPMLTSDFKVETVSDSSPSPQGWPAGYSPPRVIWKSRECLRRERVGCLVCLKTPGASGSIPASVRVRVPLLGSVGRFFWGCLSQGAVFLAMLALGLVSWPGLGQLLFLPNESPKGKSSH